MTKLTPAQCDIINRLQDGWTIKAFADTYQTVWITPNGRTTGDACPLPSLKALRKMGIVYHNAEIQEWVIDPRAFLESEAK